MTTSPSAYGREIQSTAGYGREMRSEMRSVPAYWRERFRPMPFVPAAILIAAAARAGAGLNPVSMAIDIARALLLLGQFRLWDDLADRERDREAHPSRVLVVATRVAPYIATLLLLAIVNAVLTFWLRGTPAAAAFVAIDGAAAAWYTWRPAERSAATDLVLFTKYPAFVFALAAGSSASRLLVALSAAGIYGLACAYEIWHDDSGPLGELNL